MPLRLQYAFLLAVIFVGTATVIATQGAIVGLILIAAGALIGVGGAKLLLP
jgi:hypothetical protein